ncbi:MAG: TIGR02147 family protein [Bdellovibrio sp.]|nr:TIGR02147 family protein [Bdellovibrio sp.]
MTSTFNIFESKDYKHYLLSKVGSAQQKKGVKSAMARVLSCKATYVSHVLNGSANFSLEQAEALNTFFSHTKEEGQFFLLMVLRDRAGTYTLKKNFQDQLNIILKNRMILTKRLGENQTLTEEHRSVFYSVWFYLAAHIGLTIPEWQTAESLSEHLGLTLSKTTEVLQFLCEVGLVQKDRNQFVPTTKQIRLGNESHHIQKHHTNWRIKAIESLEREEIGDLHYSAALSLSEADATKIKNILLDQLKQNLKIVADSKEEKLYGLNIDFYNLGKR